MTPIRASNLRRGDAVRDSVDLGLSRRWQSSANVFLVDAQRRTVYRPLLRAPDSDYCLCTPIWLSQRSLRIGVTTLLQVAFPELPDALRTVDVDIPTVPQFWRVPVTPVGQVPVANRPTDLTRPAEVHSRVARSDMFRYGPGEQVFRVRVHRVIAGGTFTSLEWAIVSVTGGDGGGGGVGPAVRKRGRGDSDRSQPGGRERTSATRRPRRDHPAGAGGHEPPCLERGQ